MKKIGKENWMKRDINIKLLPEVILTLIFVALKLDKTIDWSWLWVFSPMFAFEILKIIIAGWALHRRGRYSWR